MQLRVFLLSFLALVFLAAPNPGSAAEINAEGAQKLKTLFETYITSQKAMWQNPGGPELKYEGDVMVEPAGSYYAVTLPSAAVAFPDGSKITIGMVSINAAPHDKPGQWKMAVAIPTPIIMTDAKQAQALKINIGSQKSAGIWDESMENFAKLDALYKDIAVENPASGFSLQIPEAQVIYDFTQGADKNWSGPGRVGIKNMTFNFGTGMASGHLGAIDSDFSMSGYNPAAVREYRSFLEKYLQEANAQQQLNQPATPAKAKELFDHILQVAMNASDSFNSTYALSDLEINHPDPATQATEQIKIGKVFFGIDFSNLRTDKVGIAIKGGYNGFSMTPMPKDLEGIAPSAVNIDLALQNVPVRQIAEVASNTAQGAMQQPEMAAFAGIALLGKIPAILSQAGSQMEIKNNYVSNDDYKFEVTGTAHADVAAVTNVTADVKSSFSGLDKLIERVRVNATDIQNPKAADAQSLLRTLETLKANGKPSPGIPPVYTYDLQVTPQGQIMLNGAPFNAMGGVMRATEDGMPPPAAPQ